MKRSLPLAVALALGLALLSPVLPTANAAGSVQIRNLRPAFGELVSAGPATLAAQLVGTANVNGSRVLLDGVEVPSRREGPDPRRPTAVADVTLSPGEHVVTVNATSTDGGQAGRAWRISASGLGVRRIAGGSRIDTAVAVSRDLYPADGAAKGAVVARSTDFADALAGAALAEQVDGPVLLSDRNALSPATRDELKRLLPAGATVTLLGGAAALSEQVAADVQAAGFTVDRVAGDNRFATAAAAAAELTAPTAAVVANGGAFADALGASSPAARDGMPVLLVSRDQVPDETRRYLEAHPSIAQVFVVGGEAVVSTAVADAVGSGRTVTRLAGGDRYATSIEVAKRFFPTPAGGGTIAVASGTTFPDALAGGRRAGAIPAPLVLVSPGGPNDPEAFAALQPKDVVLFGGPAAVTDGGVAAMRSALYDAGAPALESITPAIGSTIDTLDTIELNFDRNLDTAQSIVYVTMNGEEVPVSIAAGDFPDTLVATPGEFPFDPAAGQRIDVRVVVAAFDGTHWRHLEFRFTYLKLDLARGDSGPAVRDLQQRLVALGYWLPNADGQFGLLTQQAVTAFQKVHGLPRDGTVGPATRRALDAEPGRPAARNGSGHHVEVDKARQVLFIVDGSRVSWIFNTSTGTEKPYTYAGVQYIAHTPSGTFTIDRQIDGYRESRLGTLYRPKYFTSDGVAVHGAASVPPFAASHGCVRVTNAAMDWIWGTNAMPIGTRVIVY